MAMITLQALVQHLRAAAVGPDPSGDGGGGERIAAGGAI